jgi:hypothetical protein
MMAHLGEGLFATGPDKPDLGESLRVSNNLSLRLLVGHTYKTSGIKRTGLLGPVTKGPGYKRSGNIRSEKLNVRI